MSQTEESQAAPAVVETDLLAALQRVLQAGTEPLTVPKIRQQLPAALRSAAIDEILQRQVAANSFFSYPKYRSQHERYWDRPLPIHVAALLHEALQDGGLAVAELRRKLPAYAQPLADSVLQEEIAHGRLYRHPRTSGRGSERVGARPADPKDYLRPELSDLFERLSQLGFTHAQLRQGALELLHEEEWSPARKEPTPALAKPAGEPALPE